jgi:prepilin-type N-terminal cleavage/methylation domain-containing protein
MVRPRGPRRRLEACDGFSLPELMIALVVATATIGAGLVVSSQFSSVYTSQLDDAAMREEARYSLRIIEDVLRSAGSNPFAITTSVCPAPGTVFRPIDRDPDGDAVLDDIRIHADVNPPNGLLGGPPCGGEANEDVTIAYDGPAQTITFLDNNVGGAPAPITDSLITNLQFTYLDANRVATANDNAVSYVQVAITALTRSRDVYLGQPRTVTVNSEVRVRAR